MTVTFAATTGHTAGDAWTIQLYGIRLPESFRAVVKTLVKHMYTTRGTGVRLLENGGLASIPKWAADKLDALKAYSSVTV